LERAHEFNALVLQTGDGGHWVREPVSVGIFSLYGLERRSGSGHNLAERRKIPHGKVGQYFAIQFHVRHFERVDQAAVAEIQALSARPGIDTGNPQRAQLTAALAAVPVGIPQAFHHRFVGATEKQMLAAPLPFGQF
jgi:hypothetical protein